MAQKTVLITGCSAGGIGDALAREFHRRGLAVFATARSAAKMAELAALGIETLELDVTSEESIRAAASRLAAHARIADHGLDMLVNNAGVNQVMPFADCSLADLRRVLDTNLFGTLAVTHALLPQLVRARGLAVLVGSLMAWLAGAPYQTTYTASKTALVGAANTLRIELAPLGVRVVTVVPGSVATQLFANQDQHKRLPDGSWYDALRGRIEGRDFLAATKWTPRDVFAAQVAAQLLKPHPPLEIWRGELSTTVRLMKWLMLWPGILDWVYTRAMGLNTLKPPVIPAGSLGDAEVATASTSTPVATATEAGKGPKGEEDEGRAASPVK